MVDSSAGKILSQARLAKRLTIDEVAHATKLRPDKIVALENDDYTRFGGLAYGKGFLQIYARFLGVDITEQLRAIDVAGSSVSIADYQYLNSPHPPAQPARRSTDRRSSERFDRRERRAPSIIPLLVVLGLGVAGLYGFYMLYAPRIGLTAPATDASAVPAVAPVVSAPPSMGVPSAAPAPIAAPEATRPAEEPTSISSDRAPSPPRQTPSVPAPEAPNSDAAFLASVNPPPANKRAPVAEEASGAVNELIVEPIKKTWVKIHKNSLDTPPIFEDYLYPGVRPLKLHGAKFFVEVRDQSAVQIRKNGHPIAYQAPGISIP